MVYYFRVQVVGVAGLGPLSEIAVVKAQAGGKIFVIFANKFLIPRSHANHKK